MPRFVLFSCSILRECGLQMRLNFYTVANLAVPLRSPREGSSLLSISEDQIWHVSVGKFIEQRSRPFGEFAKEFCACIGVSRCVVLLCQFWHRKNISLNIKENFLLLACGCQGSYISYLNSSPTVLYILADSTPLVYMNIKMDRLWSFETWNVLSRTSNFLVS